MDHEPETFLEPGKNCWRMDHARRAAFLVDGQDYFYAVFQAAQQARRSIYIAAWDIDSRVSLLREDQGARDRTKLGPFLNDLATQNPDLDIYILAWDFAMIYALEREPFPIFKLGWNSHERINFKLDNEHPLGASHHQKLVVIDNDLAFSGGFDLTKWRWDTSEHLARDERRRDPGGKEYAPFHDVQIMLQGQAAANLGELFRRRWHWATGSELPVEDAEAGDAWPEGVEPDAEDVEVAIARTEPSYKGRPEVREVEAAFLDSIAAARQRIYIENQYFTSHAISQALVERLQGDDCPEVVLVMPQKGPDWLEQATMDALRRRVLERLREADGNQRLKIYYPAQEGLERGVNVHAKVMVVDDQLLRIGSANLSNRSMGLDTECDILIESRDQGDGSPPAGLRNRLLAEHLGVEPRTVREALAEKGSLIEAVEALRGGKRTLEPLEPNAPGWSKPLAKEPELLDPEKPVELEQLVENFAVPEDDDGSPWKRWLKWSALAALILALALAWRWGPLSQWVDVDRIAAWAASLNGSLWAPAAVLAAYVLGGAVMFPVMVLIGATALIFDPWHAAAYALGGSLCSSLVFYGVGYHMGRDAIKRFEGGRLNRLSRLLAKRGLTTMIIIHLLPIAPFTLINLSAGAFHVRFSHFALGTLLGMAPGVIATTVFAEQLRTLISDPHWGNLAILAGLAAFLVLIGLITKRFLVSRGEV